MIIKKRTYKNIEIGKSDIEQPKEEKDLGIIPNNDYPATKEQIKYLEKHGYPKESMNNISKKQASLIIYKLQNI